MSKEFEPYHDARKNTEFSTWDINHTKTEEQPIEINEHEAFLEECERLKQEAIARGYAEGMESAQAELTARQLQWVQWIELITKPIQLMDEHLTQEMIQTLIWICQYCIGIELTVNPEKLYALLEDIKQEIPSLKGPKKLSMHPDDIHWVKSEVDEKHFPGLHDMLLSDPTLNRGDFYLKGEHSELDGRLHTRLITLFAKYIDKDNLITPLKAQD